MATNDTQIKDSKLVTSMTDSIKDAVGDDPRMQMINTVSSTFEKSLKDKDVIKSVTQVPGMEYDSETKKATFFGMVTVPQELASLLAASYNSFAPLISQQGQKSLYKQATKTFERRMPGDIAKAHKYARYSALGLPLALWAIPRATQIKVDIQTFFRQREKLAEELTPYLEVLGVDATGKALRSIGEEQNEMVAHARSRLGDGLYNNMVANGVRATIGSAPLLIATYLANEQLTQEGTSAAKTDAATKKANDKEHRRGIIKEEIDIQIETAAERRGVSVDTFKSDERFAKAFNEAENRGSTNAEKRLRAGTKPETLDEKKATPWALVGGALASGLTGVMTEKLINGLTESRSHKDNPVSALAMTLHLVSEINKNGPQESKYTTPDGVKNSFSLEQYVEQLFREHQKDMGREDISKARTEALQEACKKIATAIKEERMDPIALVELVGTGKIVMREGRRIAHERLVDDVLEQAIDRFPMRYTVDEKEYAQDMAQEMDVTKAALQSLPVEQQAAATALLPDTILKSKEVGYSAEDIARLNRAVGSQRYELMGQYATALVDADKAQEGYLKEMGVPSGWTKIVENVASAYAKGGADEVRKTSATSKDKSQLTGGVPQMMVNVMADELAHHGKVSQPQSITASL